jgi:hypothetical protein
MPTPGQLALFGLILDGIGAIALAGFRIRPINKLGRYLWPRYRKIALAWSTLHEEGKVTSSDYGSHALAFEIDPPESHEGLTVDRKELKCDVIELADEPDTPLKDQEISVEITESIHMPERYSMNLSSTISRGDAMSIINSNTENGFLKTGAILLMTGFGLQIVAKVVQMNSIQLPPLSPFFLHPVAITVELFLVLVLFIIWLGKMNDPPR